MSNFYAKGRLYFMKNVAKEIKKERRNVFTEREKNSKIREDYNPFKVNCKIYKKRSGLYRMKKVEAIYLKEITEKLDLKQKIIVKLFKKIFIKIYKIGIEKGFNSKM